MSTFSFLEGPPDRTIGTSTALIVSPDFSQTLMAPHKLKKLGGLIGCMPFGWKLEMIDRKSFLNWLWRELYEEGEIHREELMPIDEQRIPIHFATPVIQREYTLQGEKALDSLYIFVIRKVRKIVWEKEWVWFPMTHVIQSIDHGISLHRLYIRKLLQAERNIPR